MNLNRESYVLAADLGGTNLRTAVVSDDGAIHHLRRSSTPDEGSATDIVEAIVEEAQACIATMPNAPAAFGIAAAALIDTSGSQVLSSPNLPQLDGLPLAQMVSEKLGIPVALENDATAAAVGESWLGASRGVPDSICITLGTGVGGGLIINGRPFRGAGGTAGEIGHLCVEKEGHPCGCGSRGCIEQYASATAIVRMAKEVAVANGGTNFSSSSEFSAKDVYESALAGDTIALEVFRRMGRYLGLTLANLVNLLNPAMIVIGGGASAAWDAFIGHARNELTERAFRHPSELVKIVRAELGDRAGLLGAASAAFDAAERRRRQLG